MQLSFSAGAIVAALTLAGQALASSTLPPPLARFSHASEAYIDILPRDSHLTSSASSPLHRRHALSQLHGGWSEATRAVRNTTALLASDSLRLSFRAFAQTFHLHLTPNEDLLHPDGTIVNYYGTDESGQQVLKHSERLMPGSVRAYHGSVVHPSFTKRRLAEDRAGLVRRWDEGLDEGVVGRAAIVVHDDGTEGNLPSFEGTFTWMGNEHVIQLPHNYERARQEFDPPVSRRSIERGHIVVHRRSDIMSEEDAATLGVRALASSGESGCSTDAHEYNLNNRLFRTGSNDFNDSYSPISFFAAPASEPPRSLSKRFAGALGLGAADLFSRGTFDDASSIVESAAGVARGWSYDLPQERLERRQGGGDLLTGGSTSAANSYTSSIGSTAGCPRSQKVVYIGAAADCTYVGRFNNQTAARTQLLNTMNSVSNVYRSTFNISIGVVQMEVRDAACPATPSSDAPWNYACSDSVTLDRRLTQFSQWRGNRDANGTGLWHLLTTCNSGSEVGVAWLGTLCKTDATQSSGDVISGTGVSASTTREAQVVAHEMGHNFGAIHDCATGCSLRGQSAVQNGGATCCPSTSSSCNANAQYIMSPVSQTNTDTFSPCSIGNICTLLGRGLDTSCVVDPGQRETLSEQQCGNGILEPGEECDAGPNGSQCCQNCRLTTGSVCDPTSSPCCTGQCQFAPSSQVCRPAIDGRCDTAETCSGSSAECPTDVRQPDGTSCGTENGSSLTCATGHCTSRDLQCAQQGADMGLTRACSALAGGSSCSVSCVDPSNSNVCLTLQSYFIDGTSCGYAGTCQGGRCKEGAGTDVFKGWYRDNLRISIPVTIVVGIIVLLVIWGIIRCCVNRARGGKAGRGVTPVVAPSRRSRGRRGGQSASNIAPPPQHPQMTQSYPTYSTYGPSGPSYDAPLGPPPPAHPSSYRQTRSGGNGWVDPRAYNGR